MDILGIENAQLSVYSLVDEDFPTSLGFHRGTKTLVTEQRIKQVMSRLHSLSYAPGGEATLASRMASGLGLETGIAGTIGKGKTGEFIEKNLKEEKIQTWFSRTDVHADMHVTLLGSDGTRTMLEYRGSFIDENRPEIPENVLRSSRVLLLSPDPRTPLSLAVEAAVRKAAETGVKIILDVQSSELLVTERDRLLSFIWEYADLVFITDEAAAIITESPALPRPAEMARFFETLVVQRGLWGASACDRGREITVPAKPRQEVDVSGEGSAFAAGFLFGMLTGLPTQTCLETGLRLAQEMVLIPGTELTREKLMQIREETQTESVRIA